MRLSKGIAVAAGIAAGMCASTAFAKGFLNTESAYVGVGGGAVFLEDQDTGLTGGIKLNADTGWMADGTVGLRWAKGWRAEIEGAYRDNDYRFGVPVALLRSGRLIATGTGEFKGDIEGYSAMINGLHDFQLGKVKPYIGAGVGALFSNYHARLTAFGITSPEASQSDTSAAWQAIAGLTVPITARLEAFIDYRYFRSFDKLKQVNDEYAAHEVSAGIRYTFWQAEKAVAAAPPPPPPPRAKDYVVYFEFNKANITPAAGAVLDELKSTVGAKPVSVVGHTDTVGSLKYNQGLSERRAHAAGKALVTRGVKVESETGKSFTEPAVNTGPGVKEPLNRRAVIKVDQGAGM